MARAIHVLGSLRPGGVERWLRDTVRTRGDSPWQFDFCLLGSEAGSYAPELEALGCRIHRCPLDPPVTFGARWLALLRAHRYAVVHSHVQLFSGIVLAVARAAGVPVRIAHAHTTNADEPLDRAGSFGLPPAAGRGLPRMQRRLYEHSMAALLGCSMTRGFGCSPSASGFAGRRVASRFEVLPCGIDLAGFRRRVGDRATLRRELGLPVDVPVVGQVARLAPEKNQRFLLRVMARLASQEPRSRLVLVGDGPERPELQTLASNLGLRRRVVFTGERDDVPELMHSVLDAFALPSIREGLPAVVLEAQAAGLPGVVSDQVPQDAVVLHEHVSRMDPDAGIGPWAAALAQALHQPRAECRNACLLLERKGFDVRDSFPALTKAYDRLLAAKAHGVAANRHPATPQGDCRDGTQEPTSRDVVA